MVEWPAQKGFHLHIEALADPAHLRFGDAAGAAQGLDQGVDFPGGDAAGVGLHHHGVESLVDPAAWFEPVCLPHPAGQAAGGQAKPLGHGIAGEALLQPELHGLRHLLRCEPAPRLSWVGNRWTVWWSWRDPCRFALRIGGLDQKGDSTLLVNLDSRLLAGVDRPCLRYN